MPASSRTVSALTLGCKVNQYDTNAMLQALSEAGFRVVPWGEPCDVCLINTCTVTSVADKKSRWAIRSAGRAGRFVCVSGCLAEKEAERLRGTPGIDAVVTMAQRPRIAQIVGSLFSEQRTCAPQLRVTTSGERTRGFIKIQEGCSSFCTYCIIPLVRGEPRSRPADEILAEAQELAARGVREIVLTGIHLCSYGVDTGTDLIEILEALGTIHGLSRLHLGSLDPVYMSPGMVRRLAGIEKLAPHFHVSLQSGAADTLRAMGRRYSPAQYQEVVESFRSAFKEPAVSTDVITGFPGETEEVFAESQRFVERMHFSRLHVFPYSEREGTPAAAMPDAVPVAVRRERARAMIRTGSQAAERYAAHFCDTIQTVLFDKDELAGASGYTDRFIRVYAPGAAAGEMCTVLLNRQRGRDFDGELVP